MADPFAFSSFDDDEAAHSKLFTKKVRSVLALTDTNISFNGPLDSRRRSLVV